MDFDLINAWATRFSVGAVNVRTGNFVYFDNITHQICPEHVIASGLGEVVFDYLKEA